MGKCPSLSIRELKQRENQLNNLPPTRIVSGGATNFKRFSPLGSLSARLQHLEPINGGLGMLFLIEGMTPGAIYFQNVLVNHRFIGQKTRPSKFSFVCPGVRRCPSTEPVHGFVWSSGRTLVVILRFFQHHLQLNVGSSAAIVNAFSLSYNQEELKRIQGVHLYEQRFLYHILLLARQYVKLPASSTKTATVSTTPQATKTNQYGNLWAQ